MPTSRNPAHVLGSVTAGMLLLAGCGGGADANPAADVSAAPTGVASIRANAPSGTAALEAGDIVPDGIADSSFEAGKWAYEVADGTRYVAQSDRPLPEPVLDDMKARAREEVLASPDGNTGDDIIFVWETYGSPPNSNAHAEADTFWTVDAPAQTAAVQWETSDGSLAWATREAERIVATTQDPASWQIRVLTGAG